MANDNPQSVSDDSVGQFMSLSEDQQNSALQSMSPAAKQALLDGIRSRHTTATVASPEPAANPDNSILGGLYRRAKDTVSSIWHTGADLPQDQNEASAMAMGPGGLQVYRLLRGQAQASKEAGKQAYSQYLDAYHAAKGGDPIGAYANYVRGNVSALSALNPFATSTVTNVNKLEDEGRSREAIGQSAFDVLALIAGSRMGKKPSPAKSVNKMAYATHAPVDALEAVRGDIADTVRQSGQQPQTVGDLLNTVKQTSQQFENTFNQRLQQIASKQVVPTDIADALKKKADSLPRSAASEAQALRNEAVLYEQPWDLRELNADRMYRNDQLRSYYGKDVTGQMSAARSGSPMADKIIADGTRDLLYDEMGKQFPGEDFRALKLKQSALLDIQKSMEGYIEDLANTQAQKQGAPMREKVKVSAVASAGRMIHPFVHQPMGTSSPLTHANIATESAFGPTSGAVARRAAVLSLPVAALGRPVAPAPPQPEGP